MVEIREGARRGVTRTDWLDSRHTFSFGHYYDPSQVGFSVLRVINDDKVLPAGGFPTHPHHDMEIFTYVLEGALAHKDSMGNGSVIRPGEVQLMSAGTGVTHSEFNQSTSEIVHLLQIWIEPASRGLVPSYQQKAFEDYQKRGKLKLIISPTAEADSLKIHQDVCVYGGLFDGDERAELSLHSGRSAYVHVARGKVIVNSQELKAGDGLKLRDERKLEVSRGAGAEILLFDLPG